MPIDEKTRKKIDYALYRAYLENPRVTMKELFRIVGAMRNWKKHHYSAQKIVDKAFEDNILVGPHLYCNSGIHVTLFDKKGIEVKCGKDSIGITLVGQYSYLLISRADTGNLQYAEVVKPSFPAKVNLEGSMTAEEKKFFDQWFTTPQELNPDKKPQWDETDWKIYWAMRNPRKNFFEVGKELEMPWEIVKERFQKIVKDCKVFMGFFPLGYSTYDPLLITFTTDYETGIKKWLQGLDRSSWLFKVDDTIIVCLFHTHINLTCLKLSEMEQMGIIRDFKWAVPLFSGKGNPLI